MALPIEVEILKLKMREKSMDSAIEVMKMYYPKFIDTIDTLKEMHQEIVQAIKDAEIDANTLPFPQK